MQDKYPNEKEDKLALIVENANTRVIEIINEAILLGYTKLYTKTLIMKLVDDTERELKDNKASEQLIESTKLAILKAFMKQWLVVVSVFEEKLKQDNSGLISKIVNNMKSNQSLSTTDGKGITIDIFGNDAVIAKAGIKNLRDFMTGIEPTSKNSIITELGGTSRFVDYKELLQDTILEVKNNLANGTLTLTDSLGRVKSISNMAEIETRYKMISEDMKRQGVNLNDFVVASSHADASERCSHWQGKIFLVDLDVNSRPFGEYNPKNPPKPTPIGKIDGKDYYSLLEACNNGFLSYNCQHRLIKYYTGIQPIQYPKSLVQVKRDLTIRQRQMENTIRHWKRKDYLADDKLRVNRKDNPYIQNGYWYVNGIDTKIKASDYSQKLKLVGNVQNTNPTDKEYTVAMTNFWNDKYRQFSKDNGMPIYEWRTRITKVER